MLKTHLSIEQLEAGLETIRQAPKNIGTLEMIVRRPTMDQREVVAEGKLDTVTGLEGDSWLARGSKDTPDGSANLEAQITVMNARSIALLAQEKESWQLAGDQLFVDLDLSVENLPAGTLLSIGSTILEVSTRPHRGCVKFSERFGADALKFVNMGEGKELRLRGINTRIVQGGIIKTGDMVRKV